jgi:uncharacterized protein
MRTDPNLMSSSPRAISHLNGSDGAMSSSSLEALSLSLRTALASQTVRQHHQFSGMKVSNLTRQTVLAQNVEVADRAGTRRKGLLGRSYLSAGEGLWIIPCESVHTFFMRFSIDLVYLDRTLKVRKVRSNVPPWRLSACLSAHSVIELAPGTIRTTQTREGDQLEFATNDAHAAKCGIQTAEAIS